MANSNGQRAIPLCDLPDGQCALVRAMDFCPKRDGTCPRTCEYCQLLRAMGMSEQCMVRICRGGKRCIVQVNSTRLGICNSIARHVLVSPITDRA